jgi:hypothetical protein
MKHREALRLVIGALLLAISLAGTATFLVRWTALEQDVLNAGCGSGLHSDPCDSDQAWSMAERGMLTCGGRYGSLLGYCFNPGEYEARRGEMFHGFQVAVLAIVGFAFAGYREETPP